MVVLGALPHDELQTTLQDCRLMASLPAWWQRALFKTFLLEQSHSMMLIQMNPFGKATSAALVLSVALYLVVCTVFVVAFHLDQNSQRGVVANQAVYTVALMNLSIDVIIISPIALLQKNVLLPALVARMLRRPLSIGMQDIIRGNQVGADNKLSAVLAAKRAGKQWLARIREKGDTVQQLERPSEDELGFPRDDDSEQDQDLGVVETSVPSRESCALGLDDSIYDSASADYFTAFNPMAFDPSSGLDEVSRSSGFDHQHDGADVDHSSGNTAASEHADIYGEDGFVGDDGNHADFYGNEEFAGDGSVGVDPAGVDGADDNSAGGDRLPLPAGWAMAAGDGSGPGPYYYNTHTGVAQWEYPM